MLLWTDAAVPALLHIPCLLISWCNNRIRSVWFVLIVGAFYSVIWAFLKICGVESGIVLFCKQIQSHISPAVLTFVMLEWHRYTWRVCLNPWNSTKCYNIWTKLIYIPFSSPSDITRVNYHCCLLENVTINVLLAMLRVKSGIQECFGTRICSR